MPVNIKTLNDLHLVEITDSFDLATSNEVKQKLFKIINEKKQKKIAIDLSKINFLDSTAIGVIVKVAMSLKDKNGELVIINTSQNIKKLFTMANLNNIVNIMDNVDSAVNYFTEVR